MVASSLQSEEFSSIALEKAVCLCKSALANPFLCGGPHARPLCYSCSETLVWVARLGTRRDSVLCLAYAAMD